MRYRKHHTAKGEQGIASGPKRRHLKKRNITYGKGGRRRLRVWKGPKAGSYSETVCDPSALPFTTLSVTVMPTAESIRVKAVDVAAAITEGRLFRPGSAIRDEKAVWRLVVRYARETRLGKLAPHDLRRTCAKLCRTC